MQSQPQQTDLVLKSSVIFQLHAELIWALYTRKIPLQCKNTAKIIVNPILICLATQK